MSLDRVKILFDNSIIKKLDNILLRVEKTKERNPEAFKPTELVY